MGPPSLGPRLQQTLGQHMLLLPRMLQSIEVLQLPTLELETWLRQAAEENEALELSERTPESEPWQPARARLGREASDAHDEMLRNQPDRGGGLAADLEGQLALLDLEAEDERWVRLLIACVDEAGYLSVDDETLLRLAAEQGLEAGPERLARALDVLRSLQPRGIGARNAIEALLLQLDPGDPDYGSLRRLLEEFLGELARNRLPGVARAMDLSVGALQELLARLARLEQRPAAGLGGGSPPPLRPDVVVERDGDAFEVRIEASSLPAARIDPGVAALARERGQPGAVRSYLRGKIDRARWVLEALEQRTATLARVATRVFEHQRPFLEHGPGHLLPLRMKDLADELGIHVSTVSRAVAGKHVQTPWGTLPLRHFFQSSAGADDGSARDDVRDAVRAILEAEDATRPMSDDDVVREMARRGWKLARRTVAKYRKELGIRSSYQRRVFR